MVNIIDFFIRHKNTLLFVFLMLISLILTSQAHSYQKSKIISSTNFVTGGIYTFSNNIDSYFGLKDANQRLIDENKELRQQLLNKSKGSTAPLFLPDSTGYMADFVVHKANVISNHYNQLDNYILIDKGLRDGLSEDQGVVTSKGIVGIIEKSSRNYSRIISILNGNLAINAQLKRSNHFGTLTWPGGDPNLVKLMDIPRLAKVEIGDTIITNGRSLIFPKGIAIGKVEDYKLDDDEDYFVLDVRLFNDMTNIGNVYIIQNNSKAEIDSLRINE